ncbi:hypothetical protein MIND_00737600 [Mycena indigotica]|uniref:Uncharacterized protein n=1 Tax=Mycena indigotica TaxID=2126181 RepID=A0A8H6SPQ8_9AGAR|nr:uncharacterized protein MIND_00737600 [Mycena indigotica]KAF7301720.1 hypothetical protein MIND_00737600 [Mycena indigotica]
MPYPHDSPPVSYIPPSPSSSRRRPSISNPMGWLSRSSTQSSVTSIKTTRISEPKLILHDLMSPRAGMLGSGATVVGTPEEALRDTKANFESAEETAQGQEIEYTPAYAAESSSEDEDEIPSPIDSPPLPPIPAETKQDAVEPTTPHPFTFPPRSGRVPPSSTPRPTLRPARDSVESVPAIPSTTIPIPVVVPFKAILISDAPAPTVDRTKVIVSLETCTATYRTTIDTLTSRPSHLATYIQSYFARPRFDSTASSVYSTASAEDLSVYRRHLVSQGHMSQASTSLNIFLDRPSEPYPHILNYLRTPEPTEGPEVLPPRAAQVGLDALLELRDEAAYLGLDNLQRLCAEEINLRRRIRPRTPRTHSSERSIPSMHGSVSSLHTLLEKSEPETPQHVRSLSKDSGVDEMGQHATPTPDLIAGRRVRSQPRYNSLRPPPAGWI